MWPHFALQHLAIRNRTHLFLFYFILFCFILFYFILFYFILFCFIWFYSNLFYFILYFVVAQFRHRIRHCTVCAVFAATKVVHGDKLVPEDPSFLCNSCYDILHYDEHGKLLYADFEVYKYEYDWQNCVGVSICNLDSCIDIYIFGFGFSNSKKKTFFHTFMLLEHTF